MQPLLGIMVVACSFSCVAASEVQLAHSTTQDSPVQNCQLLEKESPWAFLCCLQQHPYSVLLKFQDQQESFRWDRVLGVLIFSTFVVFAGLTLKDMHSFTLLLTPSAVPDDDPQSTKKDAVAPKNWPILAIVGLTSYRFYTGFLSATWLPYLLAMEGQSLWAEKQSMFMGMAKLIYGATILMNPIFGLIGDHAVSVSHGIGRGLFVRIGVSVAAVGIYICVLAGEKAAFLSFLSGILVWRLGEALNDVTTEALVPEMIPQSQFGLASSIKASSFLLGGLFGYTLLMIFAHVDYNWLYFAYPIGMFACVIPSLIILRQDVLVGTPRKKRNKESFSRYLSEAYVAPTRYKGGFPRACLAVFIFSLGTAPMFFLLLIIRDLVGVTDTVQLQRTFSATSIVFFLSAAVSSVVSGVAFKRPAQVGDHTAQAQTDMESLVSRGRTLVVSMVTFAMIVLLIPCIGAFQLRESRKRVFFVLAGFFGAAFGAAFSLFQDLTWQLLPPDVSCANAMGFNVMSRLLGIGLGNFGAGLILDYSYSQLGAADMSGVVYRPEGYAIMCGCCFVATLTSSAVAYSAISAARCELKHLFSDKLAVPAA